MSRRSEQSRLLLPAIACSVLSLSAAAALVLTWNHAGAPRKPPPASAQRPAPDDDQLLHLRWEAASNDPDASRQLAEALLDRYEHGGAANDLWEAVQWIERDWSTPPHVQARLVDRLIERHCSHPVLRWNTLCVTAD